MLSPLPGAARRAARRAALPCPQCASRPASTAPAPFTPATLAEWVRRVDGDGALVGGLVPSPARSSVLGLRALNAELAGVRDATRGNLAAGRVRLAFWRDEVDAAFAGGAGRHPLTPVLTSAVSAHGLSRAWFDSLLDARLADLDGVPPVDVAALEAYGIGCWGSLLKLSLESVGVRVPREGEGTPESAAGEAAEHLGAALGIATALRGYPLHARTGVRYLPDSLLAAHGLRESDTMIGPGELVMAGGGSAMDWAEAEQARRGFTPKPAPPTPRPRASEEEVAALRASAAQKRRPLADTPPPLRMAGSAAMVKAQAAAAAAPPPPPKLKDFVEPTVRPLRVDPAHPVQIPAVDLVLSKDPAVLRKVRSVVTDLANTARARLAAARSLSEHLPSGAPAALLPAVPLSRFLDRLAQQDHDIFAGGGLGPWHDGRATTRLRMVGDVVWHAVRNAY